MFYKVRIYQRRWKLYLGGNFTLKTKPCMQILWCFVLKSFLVWNNNSVLWFLKIYFPLLKEWTMYAVCLPWWTRDPYILHLLYNLISRMEKDGDVKDVRGKWFPEKLQYLQNVLDRRLAGIHLVFHVPGTYIELYIFSFLYTLNCKGQDNCTVIGNI